MEIEGSIWLNPSHILASISFGYLSFAAKPQPNRRMIGTTMTAPRHQRKPCTPCSRRGFLAAALLVTASAIPAIGAETTEQVVTDLNTGLAISGFDPVAYFIDGAPVLGKDQFEHPYAGVVWRFRNQGNLGAFIANPDVYVPRFGGYDPLAVARGIAVPGDPRIWLMTGERLYLFYTPAARDTFANDADRLIALADRKWPELLLTLAQ